MTIHVKFFASLKDDLGITHKDLEQALTVKEAWEKATNGLEKPSNVLAAINLEYAQFSDKIKDGDEVAFFPPVTGG